MIQRLAKGLWPVTRRRSVLRVGYVEAHPWSYRARNGVQGLDTTAVSLVAGKMACSIEYRCMPPSQLAEGLLTGEYDVAIGGLIEPAQAGIVAVAVPHTRILASADGFRARCRRVFFPHVWWVRRRDVLLRYRLVAMLLWCRMCARRQHSISRQDAHQGQSPAHASRK